MKIDRKKLAKLTKQQISEVINYINNIVNSEVVNIEEVPKDYRGIVKHFHSLSEKARVYFIGDLASILESVEAYQEFVAPLNKALEKQENIYYSKPIKKVDENEIYERLSNYNEEEVAELMLLLKSINNGVQIDYENVSIKNRGLTKGYADFTSEQKIEFLEFIGEGLELCFEDECLELLYIYKDEIKELISGVKRNDLDSLFGRLNQLSIKGQKEFIEYLYEKGLETFKEIAKREKIDSCNHCFGKWKDTSYSRCVKTVIDHQFCEMPVKEIRWTHTCKECGYQESINHIPEEVVKERREKKRQSELKRLEKRVDELRKESSL